MAERCPAAWEVAGVFNTLFARAYDVQLIGGAAEPEYLPAAPGRPGIIRFTRDHTRSALHELAHWCIAGPERRAQPDYGYWYEPPPRSAPLRQAFASVEARVQALEAIFADAAGVPFAVSVDDVDGQLEFEAEFTLRVRSEIERWRCSGLNRRAARLAAALRRHWG